MLEAECFAKCVSLKTVDLPNSVTVIEDKAFYRCISLESVHLSDALRRIGDRAFEECAIVSLSLPHSVSALGDYAFANCENLTIYCEAESQPSGWSSSWNYCSNHSNATDYCTVEWGYDKD